MVSDDSVSVSDIINKVSTNDDGYYNVEELEEVLTVYFDEEEAEVILESFTVDLDPSR